MITILDNVKVNLMGKLGVVIIISLMLISCAYITIEERFVPSKFIDKSSSEELVLGGSVNHTINLDSLSAYFSLDLYQTNKRGMYFLGAEVFEERNRKFNDYDGYIVLLLGIRPTMDNDKITFAPNKLKLILKNNQNEVISYEPYKSFKTKKEVFCGYDFNENGWGTSSTDVRKGESIVIEDIKENMFDCYNIVYKTNGDPIAGIKLDLSETLLPVDNDFIYFYRQKIKWMRSN